VRLVSLLSVAALFACSPPEPAPEGLEATNRFLFTHFDDIDEGEDDGVPQILKDTILNLEMELEGLDLTADLDARKFTMAPIDGEELGTLSLPPGTVAEDQTGILVVGESNQPDLNDHAALALEENQVCIDSSSTKVAKRHINSDATCWADGTCMDLETMTETRKENILAKIWFDLLRDYRRFELDDGREVMLSRGWTEQVWEADGGGGNAWAQNFAIDVWIPQDDRILRSYGAWLEIRLAGAGDLSNTIADGLNESLIYADEFIAGDIQTCKNDRDRPYDRE